MNIPSMQEDYWKEIGYFHKTVARTELTEHGIVVGLRIVVLEIAMHVKLTNQLSIVLWVHAMELQKLSRKKLLYSF